MSAMRSKVGKIMTMNSTRCKLSFWRPMPELRCTIARLRPRVLRWALAIMTVVMGAGLGGGCDGDSDSRSLTRVPEPADVSSEAGYQKIGQQLMVALAQAKNYHHRAKVFMADGNPTEAMASVRQILSLRFPPQSPEAEDVRADARALLAKLMIGRGELDEAMRIVDEGLADASRDSFFVANLYTVRGEIHEALANAASAQGDSGRAMAVTHRREAIRAYDRSIAINSAIGQRLFDGAAQ